VEIVDFMDSRREKFFGQRVKVLGILGETV
jgi:hypothetical protein